MSDFIHINNNYLTDSLAPGDIIASSDKISSIGMVHKIPELDIMDRPITNVIPYYLGAGYSDYSKFEGNERKVNVGDLTRRLDDRLEDITQNVLSDSYEQALRLREIWSLKCLRYNLSRAKSKRDLQASIVSFRDGPGSGLYVLTPFYFNKKCWLAGDLMLPEYRKSVLIKPRVKEELVNDFIEAFRGNSRVFPARIKVSGSSSVLSFERSCAVEVPKEAQDYLRKTIKFRVSKSR
jgi:hypothetical protein